jgi:hypothetical protein
MNPDHLSDRQHTDKRNPERGRIRCARFVTTSIGSSDGWGAAGVGGGIGAIRGNAWTWGRITRSGTVGGAAGAGRWDRDERLEGRVDRRTKLKPDEKALLKKLQHGTWALAELEWLEHHLAKDAPPITALAAPRRDIVVLPWGNRPVDGPTWARFLSPSCPLHPRIGPRDRRVSHARHPATLQPHPSAHAPTRAGVGRRATHRL